MFELFYFYLIFDYYKLIYLLFNRQEYFPLSLSLITITIQK